MPPDSTSIIQYLIDPSQWTIIGILGSLAGVTSGVVGLLQLRMQLREIRHAARIRQDFKRKTANQKISQKFFSEDDVLKAVRYYVPPDCSGTDPSHGPESTLDTIKRKELFKTIDYFLSPDSSHHHLYLLGDSGTGKTAFILNYFARYSRRYKPENQNLVIMSLSKSALVDEWLGNLKDPEDTILFLDAFDEDQQAIADHKLRFQQLIANSAGFKRVLITSRTQFFPRVDEIQRNTGLRESGAYHGSAERVFMIQYLLPLTNRQVKAFLRRSYSLWRFVARRNALKLVKKIPHLALRPMLLRNIPDFLQGGRKFEHAFQLYEAMVEAWLKREEFFVKDKAKLRRFSEELAVELYARHEERGGEFISREQLVKFARKCKIGLLDEWKLSDRSLLNHADPEGNYKFAHRSIMEYLFVKSLMEGVHGCLKLRRTDQMNAFLVEVLKASGSIARFPSNHDLARYPMQLRSDPIENLGQRDVEKMLHDMGFFDSDENEHGKGMNHLYQRLERKGQVVVDFATGLMWQQGGSNEEMRFEEARKYIDDLNQVKFAGYNNWRLPTLEEAMSLMEPMKKNGDLYIDPVFDKKQEWIWTADKEASGVAWCVSFRDGDCGDYDVDYDGRVRAVRAGQ